MGLNREQRKQRVIKEITRRVEITLEKHPELLKFNEKWKAGGDKKAPLAIQISIAASTTIHIMEHPWK